jgi:hypothetical protein
MKLTEVINYYSAYRTHRRIINKLSLAQGIICKLTKPHTEQLFTYPASH